MEKTFRWERHFTPVPVADFMEDVQQGAMDFSNFFNGKVRFNLSVVEA